MVNDTNITVVSKSFSGDVLVTECHKDFIEETFGKPVCHEHTAEGEKKYPSTEQRMFSCRKNNNYCLVKMILKFL